MMFSVDRFAGEADEDVGEPLEAVGISFILNEGYYRDDQNRETARLLYLSSKLEGKAKKWWRTVDRNNRDTWEKASNVLKAQFANVEEEEEFTVLEQADRTDEEYVCHVKELFGVLGDPFGMALASKLSTG